jgi:hypothetical protein
MNTYVRSKIVAPQEHQEVLQHYCMHVNTVDSCMYALPVKYDECRPHCFASKMVCRGQSRRQ